MFALRVLHLGPFLLFTRTLLPKRDSSSISLHLFPIFLAKYWGGALCTLLSIYPAHAENSNLLAPCFNYDILFVTFSFLFSFHCLYRFSLPSPIFMPFPPLMLPLMPLTYFSESVLSLPPFCCLSFFLSFLFFFGSSPFSIFP